MGSKRITLASVPGGRQVEKIAANWVLEILDLPRESAVGFGTSATACTLAELRFSGAGSEASELEEDFPVPVGELRVRERIAVLV